MIKILKFLKPHIWSVIAVLLLVLSRGILEILLPKYMGELINQGLEQPTGPNINIMWYYLAIMAGIIIAIIIVTVVSRYFESKVASGFAKTLRSAVYEKIESFSLEEMDQFTVSSLITRTTNDIQQLQGYINIMLGWLFLQPIMAIGAIIMAFRVNASLSMVLIISLSSLLIVVISVYLVILPQFKKLQVLVDKMNLTTRENLTGLRVVRAHNTEKFQEERFNEVNLENRRLNIFVGRFNSILWPAIGLIMGFTSLAIVYLSGTKYIDFVNKVGMQPSDMFALQQYSMRAIMSLMFITMIFLMIPRAKVSADRIMAVLEMEPKIKASNNPVKIDLDKIKGKITFEDVCFKYSDADAAVIDNINFTAEAGKTTAFIGSTGSGKSTLVNLIPRFYDVTCGNIYIDDYNIKDLSFDDLYSLIGYVPQQGILFSGTIKENIAFGKNSFEENVLKSAEIAQAKTFIESFNEQYETDIAQGGTNVSGGQRQRISIARAINKQPKIFIFDDSFSALDYQTDKNLRQALKDISATKLIVAQRINTIKNADQIIVLNNGEIVGIGTHQQLLKTCSVYQEIASSQLSKEELENE